MIILQKPVVTIKNSVALSSSSNKEKIKGMKMKQALLEYKKNMIKNSDFNAHKCKQLGRSYN